MEQETLKVAIELRNKINEIIDELAPGKEVNWSEVNDIFQTAEPLYQALADKVWAGFCL